MQKKSGSFHRFPEEYPGNPQQNDQRDFLVVKSSGEWLIATWDGYSERFFICDFEKNEEITDEILFWTEVDDGETEYSDEM